MNEETKRAREQMKALPIKEKIKNYWYYYKIHFFVALAAVCILSISLVQCATRTVYDINISGYYTRLVADESSTALAEIIQKGCIDINGDGEINVKLSSNVADIMRAEPDEMTYMVAQKLAAELAASTSAGYIVDEVFKNYIVNNFGYSAENITEISSIPEVAERLKLSAEDKLYWLPAIQRRQNDKPDQFDNAEKLTEFFKNLIE